MLPRERIRPNDAKRECARALVDWESRVEDEVGMLGSRGCPAPMLGRRTGVMAS
jgi:hypothetical protein